MTLVEISIYSSLLSMLMLAIYGTFIASIKYFSVAQAQTDLQNAAQSAIMHIVADLSESTQTSMRVDTSPPGVIFASPRNSSNAFMTDSAGNILWQKWVCYYYNSSANTIVKTTLAFTPATTPPTNGFTTSFFKNAGGGTIVARNATAFSITGSSLLTITATFQTTVNTNSARTADTQVQVMDQFKVRN